MACYLVTGGAGFIGSHLCDALIKNHEVYVLDDLSSGSRENLPQGVHLIQGDVCDYGTVEEVMSKVDGCFHLAAIVSIPLCNQNLMKAHQINLTGTLNVIESARTVSRLATPVPIVFASSCSVYGASQQLPHAESAPTNPISIYAAMKLCSEYYGRFANELHGVPFTALRLFNAYGSRQKLNSIYAGVTTIFLNHLLQNQHCSIYGDGEESRDFIYVKDIVAFFIRAMETSTSTTRIINACTGIQTSITTIAQVLSELVHKPLAFDYFPHKLSDIRHSQGNPKAALELLGIQANTTIEQGLREFTADVLKSRAVFLTNSGAVSTT